MATNRRLAVDTDSDFYPTPTWATKALVHQEHEKNHFSGTILEPCCGDGAITKVLKEMLPGFKIISTDLVYRGFGDQKDAFSYQPHERFTEIITNPPFEIAEDLFHHLIPLTERRLCFLLRTAFLESAGRYERIFSKIPPTRIHVFSERVTMFPKSSENKKGGTTSFSWFVWDRWDDRYPGSPPEVYWIPPGLKPDSRRKKDV